MADDGDWIEMFKIQQLLYRYFDAVNRADLVAMRALYADDAVWEIPLMGMRCDSGDAYIELFRESTATAEFMIMTPHCPVIDLLGTDAARARTTAHELTRGTASEDGALGEKGAVVTYQNFGIYYDEIARIGGEWRFRHRTYVPIYMDLAPVTGSVATERASIP